MHDAIAICLLYAAIVTAKEKTVGLAATVESRLDEVRNSYKLHIYNYNLYLIV